MRTLRFIVEGQIIKQDPNCDFDNLVPGTDGYLEAEFAFSPEWRDRLKVIGFYSALGREYPPQVLKDNKCPIPKEALEKRTFKLRVIGNSGDDMIKTNKLTVHQNGGMK